MTPRELAAAIRKGAAIRPQCKHKFFKNGASCAIGSALEGAGFRDEAMKHIDDMRCDPYTLAMKVFGVNSSFLNELARRNDSGQTREQIADWLDTLEPTHRQTFENFMATTLQAVELEPALSHLPKE